MAGGDAVVLRAVLDRLTAWFDALKEELDFAATQFATSGDAAAYGFVALLQTLLAEHRTTLTRYEQDETASLDDRLRWLQQLGGELQALLGRLKRLDGAMPPRSEPLVAAYVRLLKRLSPDTDAVITPFRELNYELSPT